MGAKKIKVVTPILIRPELCRYNRPVGYGSLSPCKNFIEVLNGYS